MSDRSLKGEGASNLTQTEVETEELATTDRPRILLVEDTVELTEALAAQLAALGYECSAAASCDEARAHLADGDFACALIDLGLPDASGLDFLQQLREAAPQTIPIILTGDQKSDSIIQSMRTGAFDYLLKPIDMVTLRAAVSRAVQHHEAVRDRAVLVRMLENERDQLRERIAEATADLRDKASHLESSNAILHTLLDISQVSSRFLTDEDVLREVFALVEKRVPVAAIGVSDFSQEDFLGVTRNSDGTLDVVSCRGCNPASQNGHEDNAAPPSVRGLSNFMAISTAEGKIVHFDQEFWGRRFSSVAYYLSDSSYRPDEVQTEFLEMCAHSLAFEWQRSRLLLHGAQQAGLGNIANELVKGFLHALTAVQTTTEVLNEESESADGREGLRIISEHAAYLADQARAFHKLASVRSDSVETIHLAEYIDHALSLLGNTLEQRGIALQRDYHDTGECILLNGAALASTFLDLISTVVRTASSDGTLHVAIAPEGEDAVLCQIAFEPGADQTPRVEQTDIAESVRSHPRFMLAQRTVQSCGGALTVGQRTDDGATFNISLPRNGLAV